MKIEIPELADMTQEQMRIDLRSLCRGAVKLVIESVLEEVVQEIVGAGRYARLGSRMDQRNGSYLRRLVTSMGQVELRVPRTRHHGAPTDIVGRYKRRMGDVDEAIVAAYVNGVSTRGMSDVTEALMGEGVSSSSVSRVTEVLEEQVDQLRNAPIEGAIPYLYLDATFLDARWAREVQNVSALVAYGVTETGHRQLLGVTIGHEESEDSWTELLRQLIDRGLTGVRLVITDEHAGLKLAVRKLLPEVPRQRCMVHFMRNVLSKVKRKHQKRLARELSALFNSKTLKEAKAKKAALTRRFAKQFPEAMDCLADGFTDATQFFAFPAAHRQRIRSTNGLERLHGEIKRRTKAVGAFPDRASALRLITAVALRVTTVWAARRYLDMSLLDEAKEKATQAA